MARCSDLQQSGVSWPEWMAEVSQMVELRTPKFQSDPRFHRRQQVVAEQIKTTRMELLTQVLKGKGLDLEKEEENSGFSMGSLQMPIKLEMPQWFSR